MSDIVVIGSLNLDLVARVHRFPSPGETVIAQSFQMAEGGKGANQAVAAARLGASVAMVGRVGQDAFGQRLRASLSGQGVDTAFLFSDITQPTGTAMITVNDRGDNSIVICSGANGALSRDDIRGAEPLFASTRVAVVQCEIPLDTVEYALETFTKHSLPVILNAAPALPEARALLGRATILVVNESEAAVFSGMEVTGPDTAGAAALNLLSRGAHAVIITLGRHGAVLADGLGVAHVPAPEVNAVDTTGAGDAFVGALAVSLMAGKELLQAVEYAAVAGALAVTQRGAQPSMPTAVEVAAGPPSPTQSMLSTFLARAQEAKRGNEGPIMIERYVKRMELQRQEMDTYYGLAALLRLELAQRGQEGCDVSKLRAEIEALPEDASRARLGELYDRLDALEPQGDWSQREPSDINAILWERPDGPRRLPVRLGAFELSDRVLGGWLGRCAGCCLGKPVECWHRDPIRQYLESTGDYPLRGYMAMSAPLPSGCYLAWNYRPPVQGRFDDLPRDDDTDYPILGLHVLEHYGFGFTTANVADTWLAHLPYYRVYTAELVAYRNRVNGLQPPATATYRNPFREFIGAQIRGDIFGYVAPGLPELAANMAFRDARLSHTKNGIYGEMFVAAMIAAAFVLDDARAIVEVGLSEIPANSRLASAIRKVLEWSRQSERWENVWNQIADEFGHYDVVHTINNAAIVALGLLFGKGGLGPTISIATMGGWDTDCNAATVGSIVGVMRGAASLPTEWTVPLGDHVRSDVAGYDHSSIRDLATRTTALALRAREQPCLGDGRTMCG